VINKCFFILELHFCLCYSINNVSIANSSLRLFYFPGNWIVVLVLYMCYLLLCRFFSATLHYFCIFFIQSHSITIPLNFIYISENVLRVFLSLCTKHNVIDKSEWDYSFSTYLNPCFTFIHNSLRISSMYILNNIGDIMQLCLTPFLISTSLLLPTYGC